jgi:hypothetical protein
VNRLELIQKLQEATENEVAALTQDGEPFEITDVQVHRGLLCVVEGDEAMFPEAADPDDDGLFDEDEEYPLPEHGTGRALTRPVLL